MYTLSPFCYSCLSVENLQCIKTVDFDNVSLLDKFKLCISNGNGKLKDLNYICIICCSALRIAYKFKTMVLSNQNIIKGYVKKLQPNAKGKTEQSKLQVHVLNSSNDQTEDSEIVYLSDSDSRDSDIIEISCEKFSKRNGENSKDNFEIFIKDEKIETIDLYHDDLNNDILTNVSIIAITIKMGALTSRQNPGVEEVDVISTHAYKYPPRSGNYFGSHFIMGGERFDTPQPESYLFGENSDLNFLGSRPTSFPYPPPQANEPTKTLKSLVNIRKESLRFVRAPPDYNKIEGDQAERDLEVGKGSLVNIEFTFDCDVRCAITIYYFCTEEITNNGVTYIPRDATMNSATYHYKRGANQQFCQMSHCFDPSRFNEEELLFNSEKEVIPIAIHCIAEEGTEEIRQSHTTIAIIEKHPDGSFVIKALKQKLFVDGLCYLLQEIYGIENKNHDTKVTGDEETEDNGSECVICMCDVRDTLILPCRHLCLCNSCADSLRYQANNCPICRAPFRALLQIRALQRTTGTVQPPPANPPEGSCDNIPPGYTAVSLIEALNGPCVPQRQPPAAVLDMVETPVTESAIAAAAILNRANDEGNRNSGTANNTPEFRMSVLMSRDEEVKDTQKSPLLADHSGFRGGKLSRPRDTVRHVNEKNASLEKDETQDEDSEAEKLSPLLHNNETVRDENLALEMAGVVEPIDDTDTEHEDQFNVGNPIPLKTKIIVKAPQVEKPLSDDSAPPILGPLCAEKEKNASSVGLNSAGSLKHGVVQSLPGTPVNNVRVRNSGDCAGDSSSRHFLMVAPPPAHEKSVQI